MKKLNNTPQNIDIKQKFVSYVSIVELIDNKYSFNYEMLDGDSDFDIIKEKMDNFISKINSIKNDELEKFCQLDVETEIWNMI